jgi:hypothetical protein
MDSHSFIHLPFLANGIRFVADDNDSDFIRNNLERNRDCGIIPSDIRARPRLTFATFDKLHIADPGPVL